MALNTHRGLHAHLLDALGQDIVDGRLSAGDTIDPTAVGARHGVSRSVVREVLRVLQSLGMVEPRQRVGTQVLPLAAWDLMAPLTIRWRGSSHAYSVQQREMLELRLGLEPVAAGLAATALPDDGVSEVLDAARTMTAARAAGDGTAYLEADVRFHTAILAGSGNAVFGHFAGTVEALLRTRTSERRFIITEYTPAAADRHLAVALAVARRDPEASRAAAHALVAATLQEFTEQESSAQS